MNKLSCIFLCTSWNCCRSSQSIQAMEVQEHRRTQLGGLDQAIRSINFSQHHYSRQIDEPNQELTFSSETKLEMKPDHISQDDLANTQ